VDVSLAALEIARTNVRRHRLGGRVRLTAGDLLAGIEPLPRFEALIANLPYVEPDEFWRLPPAVRDFEPATALTPPEGAATIRRRLLQAAVKVLNSGGWIALEVGAGQAGAARSDLLSSGFRRVEILNDYAGIGRIVSAELVSSPA
jgi:release factor glutamine methyltransferase